MKKILSLLVLVVGVFSFSNASFASEYDTRIWEANEVIKEYMRIPEHRIPPSLLKEAQAIAIFPSMIKAGFIVAGQYGEGVVINRDSETGEWTSPAFFRISGGSVGLQIGGQASDAILVITSERGVRGLLSNKFTLGADASVAAGPAGRDAEAKTDWKMKSTIYSYSRSKGLFAGVSLDGMVINQDKKANSSYYGVGTTAESILFGEGAAKTEQAKELVQTLKEYTS